MRIAVASGKGGTGKTTVATNLAALLHSLGISVSYADCDVEEPNGHHFLKPTWQSEEPQYVTVPAIDTSSCLGESCQRCIQECRFNALIWMVHSVLVFPELCHGCGLCMYLCPEACIVEDKRRIGVLKTGRAGGIPITSGELRIGEAMAPPLIRKVLAAVHPGEVEIVDAPPGASCPVIACVQDVDFVLLVAEPTPFGLYDLQLAAKLMDKLQQPFGVIINRDGMGDERVDRYIEESGLLLLGRLPYSRQAAEIGSQGGLLVEQVPEIKAAYAAVWESLCREAGGAAQRSTGGFAKEGPQ
jgi:MinD superfamily P-loop ATPase